MSKNCIGIFYLINGRIVSEKAPVSKIKPSGAVRRTLANITNYGLNCKRRMPIFMIWIAILCPVGESAIMRKGRNSRSLLTPISWKKIRSLIVSFRTFVLKSPTSSSGRTTSTGALSAKMVRATLPPYLRRLVRHPRSQMPLNVRSGSRQVR